MIDVRQLRYFLAVAEELHFAKAADRLDVAQSALSTQIQRLERDLGVTLLNRNKRQPVTLTDAGHLFHTEAVAALRHLERADQVGRLAARGLAGVIRIGFVASAVSSGLLSRLLTEFRCSHENVRVEVVQMESPRQLEALKDGQIDVGIVRPRRLYPAGVIAKVVQTERLLVAMARSHPLASRASVPARVLAEQPFIVPQFDDEEGFGHVLSALGKAGGFTPHLEYRVQDFISAISMASAGYGIAIVPESMRNFSQPGICYKQIADFSLPVHLALAHRRRELSAAVRAFVKLGVAI
ncbi:MULTISPECIES: LysR family transcriptional regulator [unclassified Cupriavidus]|uniref:LysR family transcriptional regulator n=1 Tax=unclassified Cupriavidus TaxID=2640874 RepID=UPI00048B5490|nr:MULTISPECIES: LysR family transcriptional regulator [unclassified Cupriavidus]MBP0631166.1 LysR family transcriptional regulator [Cupriavidus sp. AcVe19-1a]MBP0638544.1 LysR family transcriptional regulator [Cupriavidus sp. AcVe19-6a]